MIHSSCKHTNILKFIEHFESKGKYYLITNFQAGGDLIDYLNGLKVCSLPERHVKYFAFQIGQSLFYLHKRCIVHRDIKPENVLLSIGSNDATLSLTDFGNAV